MKPNLDICMRHCKQCRQGTLREYGVTNGAYDYTKMTETKPYICFVTDGVPNFIHDEKFVVPYRCDYKLEHTLNQ